MIKILIFATFYSRDKCILQKKLSDLQSELFKSISDLSSSKTREEALQLQVSELHYFYSFNKH